MNWFDFNETEAEHTIRCVGVKRCYERGEETVKALDGVDLTVERGAFVSIMGPSGSGKSTLFNCMGALDQPTAGSVFVDEVDIAELDSEEMAWLRCRKIGYIFQSYNIVQVMTTVENVMLPMIFGGVEADEALQRAVAILGRVGLGDRLEHKALELSGGQQQRVAIARAFANKPAIILADEPTANLDLVTGEEIIRLLVQLNREEQVTVITATHDFEMLKVSDRVVWIRDGRIERIQRKDELDITVSELHAQAPARTRSNVVDPTNASTRKALIRVRDVERTYRMRGEDVHALRGVSLDVHDGEYLSIMGPSGSGKTTLFNMIGGLDRPTAGTLSVDGVALADLNSRDLAWFRCCKIGYIFQTFNLVPTLSALQNVMLPCTFRRHEDRVAAAKAEAALEAVELGHRLHHLPHELSGGQMQRVAIARALANEPRIVLADEPTGNLDLVTGEAIIRLLRRLNQERGVTVVTVTHDHKMLSVSNRIVWFSSGVIDRIEKRDDIEIDIGHIA